VSWHDVWCQPAGRAKEGGFPSQVIIIIINRRRHQSINQSINQSTGD